MITGILKFFDWVSVSMLTQIPTVLVKEEDQN